MNYNYLELAKRLRRKREEKGISLRTLGEKIDVSHTEIARIEKGLRPHFSFITLAKLCKELDIDMVNLLDDVGVWEFEMDQLYYVMFKQDEENIFKIHARCEGEAIRLAFDFVLENNLIDFKKSDKDILMGAVKNLEDFDKEIIKNYERTGKLYDTEDDDLKYEIGIALVDEEDDDEEINDSEEEIEGVICPEDCIYYCPNCGSCTKRD